MGKSALFLSCDLVGSTSYKQASRGWQKIFLSFYREFPQFLAEADRKRHAQDGKTTSFTLWKAVGDELIFEVDVTHEHDVARAVRVWVAAIRDYETQSLAEVNLALKGGAFIATFPGPDSESTIPRKPDTEDSAESVVRLNDAALAGTRAHRKYLFDYFGPSIDTGFRLYSLSSHRYFTLSIEVAWAMAVAAHQENATPGQGLYVVDDLAFLGGHVLKGVWGAREYPVFAIDRQRDDPVNRAMAQLRGETFDAQKVIGVCDACSNDSDWPFCIYLPDSHHTSFQTVPIDAMRGLRENEGNLVGAETAIPQDDTGDPLDEKAPLGA
ncbi:hypothetical protein [Agromyces badenianii]|uniref:hypothetical protein n=1 Tax=Agromyces badenianii TaxID=2080742 RepID=UPI001059F1A0|nr:hypothetical protein [Agromyces badenianii]